MASEEIKSAIREALRDGHVCQKEEEIAELEATCHRIKEFTGEIRENNSKLGLALEKLAVGDERLKTIGMLMERNEVAHDEFKSRLSNLGRIVEHDHAPVIDGIRGFGKFMKAVALTVVTVLAIAVGALLMEEWAEHKALRNAAFERQKTEGRP